MRPLRQVIVRNLQQPVGQHVRRQRHQPIGSAGADAGLGQCQPGFGCRQHAADAPREVEPCRHQQPRAGLGIGAGEIGCLRRIQACRQHRHQLAGGGCRQGGQFVALLRQERIGAGQIDQHRDRLQPAGDGAGKADRMRGDDEVEAEQAGEGRQLFGGAGAAAVRRHHQRRDAGHHQPRRQPRHRQRLARTGRPGEQQRLGPALLRQFLEGEVGGERAGQRAAREFAGERVRHAMELQRRFAAPVRSLRQRRRLGRFQRRGDLDAVGHPAGVEDQRIGAQLGANAADRLGRGRGAIQFQPHQMLPTVRMRARG